MKKSNLRYLLFSGIIMMSLCSYIFLSSVSVEQSKVATEEVEEQNSNMNLPDVKIIKKVIKNGKDYIFFQSF